MTSDLAHFVLDLLKRQSTIGNMSSLASAPRSRSFSPKTHRDACVRLQVLGILLPVPDRVVRYWSEDLLKRLAVASARANPELLELIGQDILHRQVRLGPPVVLVRRRRRVHRRCGLCLAVECGLRGKEPEVFWRKLADQPDFP